jgi:hypothetical protein
VLIEVQQQWNEAAETVARESLFFLICGISGILTVISQSFFIF